MSVAEQAIQTVAIVGRGIIGASWAIVFARAGLDVKMWCRDPDEIPTASERLTQSLELVEGTGLGGGPGTLDRISWSASLEEVVTGADYVQESVSERIELKREILAEIERYVPTTTILGSSSSGLMPSEMARDLAHPGRFLLVHPLTPPHVLPVTELCPGTRTHPETLERTREFMVSLGQAPVVLRAEVPGFALNRVIGAMLNECFALVRDGVIDPADIDVLFTEGLGLRWGVIGPLAAIELNAPGGIGDYLDRYGSIWDEVARSRGAKPVLEPGTIARVAEGLATRNGSAGVLSRDDRALQRDRRVALIRAERDRILRG